MIDPLTMQVILSVFIIIEILRALSIRVGAWWLRLSLIILLITMLLVRVDKIGVLVGNDIIGDNISNLITIIALATIAFAFEAARVRASYLRRAERERRFDLQKQDGNTFNSLEELREKDQMPYGHDWSVIPKPKNPELMARRRTDSV